MMSHEQNLHWIGSFSQVRDLEMNTIYRGYSTFALLKKGLRSKGRGSCSTRCALDE